MKKQLFLLLVFVIGMITMPRFADAGPPVTTKQSAEFAINPLLNVTPIVYLNVLTATEDESFIDPALTADTIIQVPLEESTTGKSPIVNSPISPQTGIGWEMILTGALVLLELLFRIIPTSQNISILGILYSLLNYVVPNRTNDNRVFNIRKEDK